MNMTKTEIKKLQSLCLKAKNTRLKQQAMVLDSFSGLVNGDQMANGLVLTPISSPLKERNISIKSILGHSIITIPTMWIIHPSKGTYSSTMTRIILPKGTIIGSSKENVLMYVPQWTLPTLQVRSLISLVLSFLVLIVFTIITFWK